MTEMNDPLIEEALKSLRMANKPNDEEAVAPETDEDSADDDDEFEGDDSEDEEIDESANDSNRE